MSFWAKLAKDPRMKFLLQEGDRRRGPIMKWRAYDIISKRRRSMLRTKFRNAGKKQDRLMAAIYDRREWQR